MRLFKRRCSDPSPQLVSLSHIEEPTVIEPSGNTVDPGSTPTASTPENNYPVHRGVSDTNLAATAGRLFPRSATSNEGSSHHDDALRSTKFNGNSSFSEIGGHDSRHKMADSEPASRDTSAERSNKKGLTTWSKKVSRRWDALRRSDSSEIPTTPDSCADHRSSSLQSHLSSSGGGRRQQYSLSTNIAGGSNDDISVQNQKRVSRVESIRNLFGRQKDKTDGQEFKKRFDDIVSKVGVNTVLRNKRKNLVQQMQSPSYELNEKQLLEYLLLCRPEGCNRSLDELIQNFKDTVRGGTSTGSNDKGAALSGVNKRLGVLREESQNANRHFNNSHRHSAPVVASSSSSGTSASGTNLSQNPPLSVDDLCAVLNGILASTNGVPSNRILRPTDESGYDSDSTRTGSPRGSERGVDSPRSSPRGSIKVGSARGSQISSKRGSLEERPDEQMEGYINEVQGSPEEYLERNEEGDTSERGKRLSWQTANELLQQMCADSSLNDSNTSKSLLEGFNCSIRTLTNVSANANEHNADLDKTPVVYTGDTADEHSSSDEEEIDCDTLKRNTCTSNTSTVRRRSNSVDKRTQSYDKIKATKSLYLDSASDYNSTNNLFLNSTSLTDCTIKPNLYKQNYDVIFDENLQSLPSFSKIEREFSSLKTLNKTSTGLDNEDVFVDGSVDNNGSISEQNQQKPVVRPGVVDELVEDFENRVRSSTITNTGTIIRKGLLHVNTSNEKEFKCARLFVKNDEFCGLLVEKAESGPGFTGTTQRTGCIMIVGIEKNSPANLNGTFRINDELVKVNGRRMRGLSLKDVREYLNQTGELEIVVSRLKNQKNPAPKAPYTSKPIKSSPTTNLYQSKSTTTLFKQNKTFADNFSTTVSFANLSNTFQNRSKLYQDQNWTLTQKTVPKIGQLYTPLALSNSRAKSFIDDKLKYGEDQVDDKFGEAPSLFTKRNDDKSSMLIWNHRSDHANKKDGEKDLFSEREITIRSQKRVKEDDTKPELYLNDHPVSQPESAECCCSLPASKCNKSADDQRAVDKDAPKIVGGTLKPNVNPEDVQIKKDKVNIDRSFEIESPVKKFAASPAKLGISSIGRRSSPAKLTGMKKFYYGHQKRRSLQAILSPDRPHAEPIMSAPIEENDQQSQETKSQEDHSASDKTLRRNSWNPTTDVSPRHLPTRSRNSKNFGSFQSIPEHYDTTVKRNTSCEGCETYLRPSSVAESVKKASGYQKVPNTRTQSVSENQTTSTSQRRSCYSQEEPVPKVISRPAELLKVQFVKGAGRPSLGFTIAGGSDSPKGSMGIYVKTVLPGGQAEKQGCLRTGDEILSVNTVPLCGLTRTQATAVFAKVRTGTVTLRVLRRGAAPAGDQALSGNSGSNRCLNCNGVEPALRKAISFGTFIKEAAENTNALHNTNTAKSGNTLGIPTEPGNIYNCFNRPKTIYENYCFDTYSCTNSDSDTDMTDVSCVRTDTFVIDNSSDTDSDMKEAPLVNSYNTGSGDHFASGNTHFTRCNTHLAHISSGNTHSDMEQTPIVNSCNTGSGDHFASGNTHFTRCNTYTASGNARLSSGNTHSTYVVSGTNGNAEGAGDGGGGGDFDMRRDVDACQSGRSNVKASGGYFKRAKRLYSAITTNI